MTDNQNNAPAAEAEPHAAQASEAEAETAATSAPTDELSGNDLEAVAGGARGVVKTT
jgi:hypothetical protein